MHRTQVLIQDELYDRLRVRARSLGVSMSELIRGTLEQAVEKNPKMDAQAFFDRLDPLESFADIDQDRYVRELRSTSRVLRGDRVDA